MIRDAIMYKKRDSNLELYRIIVMLLIVAHHYVVNSGLIPILDNHWESERTLFYYLFGLWGKVGINCFVLITGYYMCTSSISLRKFMKLFFEIEFYHVICYLIFVVTGYVDISLKGAFRAIWPVNTVDDGFASCFLLFYLCIPFLNVLISNVNQKAHRNLILLGLFIYTVLGTIPLFYVEMNYVSWFSVLYFIASYIRLYEIPYKQNVKFWGWGIVISLIITTLTVIIICFVNAKFGKNLNVFFFVKDSNKILAVVVSICAFNYFRNIKLTYNKYVNMMGASTFGVLLIHAGSDDMRRWLWKDTLHVADQFYSDYFVLHALFSCIGVFLLCVCVDQIRLHLLEKPLFAYLDKTVLKETNTQ